jgi:hypothetical protein
MYSAGAAGMLLMQAIATAGIAARLVNSTTANILRRQLMAIVWCNAILIGFADLRASPRLASKERTRTWGTPLPIMLLV